MMFLFLLLLSCLGRGSAFIPDVSCLIINLQHTDCTWDPGSNPELNLTFQSRLGSGWPFHDCPQYLHQGGYNVGCRLPYERADRFSPLHTRLSDDNNVTKEQTIEMKERVKLNPPLNLSMVVNSTNLELWLYWNTSTKSTCTESEVRYRKEGDQWHSVSTSMSATSYSLPQISLKHRYELQVRIRVPNACGQSMFWSDWSVPMFWGNTTVTTPVPWKAVYSFIAVVVLGILMVLIYITQGERIRIIFVPVVPNPGKNLEDLFKTCNGNVEEWLHISKEFKEGFQPNYSEPACLVRECPAYSEATGWVSVRTDQSERPSMVPSLSVSPPVPENVPPGLV
ncbi:cytokine receptor common subunit gamma-like [Brienomyrus brachyistius]|uniref:cytokine receptor common subunit gamma-like n=1 Tax=Brienomyrus brachyistius TaxID=42636 RepID=UPI0020B36244|nr:cytokine receptor common subunit gamma-like [Brienomyrus brachyistius]